MTSQPPSTGGFKWLKNDKWDDRFTKKEGIGYFVECDFEYPGNLHDLHNDYPLALEKIAVQENGYHRIAKKRKEKFNLASDRTTRLIPTLFNKNKYVLHIRNLELYLELGLKLTKIHKVLQFNEFP